MKVEKTITVPEQQKVVVDHYKCDLCDVTTRDQGNWKTEQGMYAVNRTTIEMTVGTAYPGDCNVTTTEFHICIGCFEAKLLPWFEAQGATPTITET